MRRHGDPDGRRVEHVPRVGTITRTGSWRSQGLLLTAADGRTALVSRRGWRQRPVFDATEGLVWTPTSRLHLEGTITGRSGPVVVLRPDGHGRHVLAAPDGRTLATFRGGAEVDVEAGADPLHVLAALCLIRWQEDDAIAAALAAVTAATST